MITTNRVIDLSSDILARCRELTFGDEGYMCDDLDRILYTETRKQYRNSMALTSTDNHGTIHGWALLQPVYKSPKYTFQVFVDPDQRGTGHGSSLLRVANRVTRRKLYVFRDEENDKFFQKHFQLCQDW